MKLAIALRHLASGSKYTDMRFGWRVPHNTISIIVRETIVSPYVVRGIQLQYNNLPSYPSSSAFSAHSLSFLGFSLNSLCLEFHRSSFSSTYSSTSPSCFSSLRRQDFLVLTFTFTKPVASPSSCASSSREAGS